MIGQLERHNTHGSSKTFRSPDNKHFLKLADEDTIGNPHSEPASAKAFELMGVPHVPNRVISHPDNPTRLFNVSPMLTGVKPIMNAWAKDTPTIIGNPQQTANSVFAEWVANVGDRHGYNYVWSNEHKHPISIDHGIAWHPGNHLWANENVAGEPYGNSFRISREPDGLKRMVEDPMQSDLINLHRELKGPWPLTVDPTVVQNALMNQDKIAELAYEGTKGLPEPERRLASTAVHVRMNALRKKLAETGGKLRIDHLHDLYNEIRNGDWRSHENHLRGR